VEAAEYFAVSEARANAAKHSHAREARIAVSYEGPVLTGEVVDDGLGGAAAGGGSGLRGLTDRLEALGGRLIVSGPPGGRPSGGDPMLLTRVNQRFIPRASGGQG
jgi:signal transduction histidine kinase